MSEAADFTLKPGTPAGGLALVGDWTVTRLGAAGDRLQGALKGAAPPGLDVSRLGRIDTTGAYALARAGLEPQALRDATPSPRPDAAQLVELVREASRRERTAPRKPSVAYDLLVRAGEGVSKAGGDLVGVFAFNGRLLVAMARLLAHPSRIRMAPTVALMERAGLDAAPIVATTNFFVGATIAFLGATLLAQFGASVFTVELVGIGVLREFGVLITAIILAGRSASSFAAEIGAMKMNQEIDAMSTIGVDPFEALVLPRFVAMLLMTPLLAFLAMMAGIAGGVLVVWAVLGLSPAFFFQRMLENVAVSQFWIGIVKAPVMAVVIATIGCREGLSVGGRCRTAGAAGHQRGGAGAVLGDPDRRRLRLAVHGVGAVSTIPAEAPAFPGVRAASTSDDDAVIRVRGLVSRFDENVVHDGLDLTVRRGEVLGLVGGSGAGKSVLLNTLIGLRAPDGGAVDVLGIDVPNAGDAERAELERRWGVLFQSGALFSSLSVRENVGAPLIEHAGVPHTMIDELSDMKIALTGLPPHAGDLRPAELSGGMRKRAGLARALALDPELLFLDEPTAGLDPIAAEQFDTLIKELHESLGLTVFMITHDLDSLYAICDRVAVIADKKVVATAPISELETSDHPWIKEYFLGPRGRAATATAKRDEAMARAPVTATGVR